MDISVFPMENGNWCVKAPLGLVYFGSTRREALGGFLDNNLDILGVTIQETIEQEVMKEMMSTTPK